MDTKALCVCVKRCVKPNDGVKFDPFHSRNSGWENILKWSESHVHRSLPPLAKGPYEISIIYVDNDSKCISYLVSSKNTYDFPLPNIGDVVTEKSRLILYEEDMRNLLSIIDDSPSVIEFLGSKMKKKVERIEEEDVWDFP